MGSLESHTSRLNQQCHPISYARAKVKAKSTTQQSCPDTVERWVRPTKGTHPYLITYQARVMVSLENIQLHSYATKYSTPEQVAANAEFHTLKYLAKHSSG